MILRPIYKKGELLSDRKEKKRKPKEMN